MFVSKKKYDALVKDHHECLEIANRLAEINSGALADLRKFNNLTGKAYDVLREALYHGSSLDWPIAMEEAIGYLGEALDGIRKI